MNHLLPFLAAAEVAKPGVDPWIFSFSLVTVVATLWLGFWSARKSRTASDFFVAGRSVSVGWNASAISGEYLSAASFMGIAGQVMLQGYDVLWYPVCYACGYLFLLLFIAGPLRRFGAYTIPDFAEGRYDSPVFRKIAVLFVLFIGLIYTMPQMKGAGTTLAYIFPGMPYWGGIVLVGAVITLNVALGGMKGITLVQAFQYWLKLTAICIPVFILMSVYGFYGSQLGANDGRLKPPPATPPAATTAATTAAPATPTMSPAPPATPPPADGIARQALVPKAPADQDWISPFGPLTTKAVAATAATMPDPVAKKEFLDTYKKPYSLLYTYSLIIALVCGTAGLPHILVRFYTNPDGVAAKRTTLWVMILIGVFYMVPPILGVLGRNFVPGLYSAIGAKGTDKVVLELPNLLNEKYAPLGSILSGIACAGAFAAFMSTFSGLLVSMTGALAHDVYGRMLRPKATAEERMSMFKWCAVIIGTVAVLLGMLVENFDINYMVGQAFAVAASSYFPLLFMSMWWRNLTMKGAASGMLGGGLLAMAAISTTSWTTFIVNMTAAYKAKSLPSPDWLTWMQGVSLEGFWAAHPLLRILGDQPAIWTIPLAITLMVVISKATSSEVPADIRQKMLVLHAPEKLGLKQEYIQEHTSTAGH